MIKQIKFSFFRFLLITVSIFHFFYLFLIITNVPIKIATIIIFLLVSTVGSILFTLINSETLTNRFVEIIAPILILTFFAVIADKILTFQLVYYYMPILLALVFFSLKSKVTRSVFAKINTDLLENINIFIFLYIVYTGFGYFCYDYTNFDFDSQNFSVWEYAAFKNYLPYKDIFYPYGILDYFKNKYIFFNLLYALLNTSIIVFIFIGLKFALKDRFSSYISLFVLFILSAWFTRYGIVAAMAFLYAYILYKKYYISRKCFLILGIVNGLIFSIVNDAGIYIGILFLVGILILPVLKYLSVKNTVRYYISLSLKLFVYLAGFLIGTAPLMLYLWKSGNTFDFLQTITNISVIGEYAKIPFWTSLIHPYNLLICISLIFSSLAIGYRHFNKKNSGSYIEWLQLFLFISLLLLNYKNVMRPIYEQINFVAVLLLLSFWRDFADILKKDNIPSDAVKLFFAVVLFFTTYIFENNFFGIAYANVLEYKNKYSYIFHANYSTKVNFANADVCPNRSFENLKKALPSNYNNIKEKLGKEPDFNGKVFSFPGMPILYVLFNQQPPRHFSGYDASPLFAQEGNIKYLEANAVNYVIYWLNYAPIDNVPFSIRNVTLYRYILNNFEVFHQNKDFIILKRTTNNKDFFADGSTEILKAILRVDLESIPNSEGVHKGKWANSNGKIIYESGEVAKINNFLADNKIFSSNKYLLLYTEENDGDEKYSVYVSGDGLETQMNFKGCGNEYPCIINLSNVPLFFKSRKLERISVGEKSYKNISIVEIAPNNVLW